MSNNMLERLTDNIYRLCIPFEDIYTTAFILLADEGCVVYDSGNSSFDAEKYVIPTLKKMDIVPDFILCSHSHGDHSGGLATLSDAYPSAVVGSFSEVGRYKVNNPRKFDDGDCILDRYTVLNLKGHSADGLALLDSKAGALITGDCLQAGKVGRYGIGVSDSEGYFETINRLKGLKLKYIFASHDYQPLSYSAIGEKAVLDYLNGCEKLFVEKLKRL